MKKSFSKRKFVFCASQEKEIPIENHEGCCEFYNEHTQKCEYKKYSHRSSIRRLSEREEVYRAFSGFSSREELENDTE